jgi:uncharacterized protein
LKTHPLNITVYLDTRPGHIKQSRGLIRALSELSPVQVNDIVLPEYGFRQSLYDWMQFGASLFKHPPKKSSQHQDLIIGTGSHTHIPMLLEKQKSGGRVITCMMPELPLLRYMDLCFVPEHDAPPKLSWKHFLTKLFPQKGMISFSKTKQMKRSYQAGGHKQGLLFFQKEVDKTNQMKKDNIFITQGPPNTALDTRIDHQERDPEKGLIVIGGVDHKTHIWDNEKILDQIQTILKIQADIVWTISTSPRTPATMTPLLKNLSKNFSGIIFMPFEKTGQGWIEEQYAKSNYVWVSADSVSMVFEALSAGCRVGVLAVDWKKNTNKIARAVNLLEQKKRIVSFKNFMNKPEYMAQAALNEARRCAEEILRRWWPNRLP